MTHVIIIITVIASIRNDTDGGAIAMLLMDVITVTMRVTCIICTVIHISVIVIIMTVIHVVIIIVAHLIPMISVE